MWGEIIKEIEPIPYKLESRRGLIGKVNRRLKEFLIYWSDRMKRNKDPEVKIDYLS